MTTGWELSQKMMPLIRKTIAELPAGCFLDIETATAEKDMHEATDLILRFMGGDMAVRVRRFKCGGDEKLAFDWSIRFRTRHGNKTEIHKFREGFARWYFIARANEDETSLFDYCLIDLDKCRASNLFREELWEINPNNDGSAGGYMSIQKVYELGCLLWPKEFI